MQKSSQSRCQTAIKLLHLKCFSIKGPSKKKKDILNKLKIAKIEVSHSRGV